MIKDIEALADELYQKILAEYKANPDLTFSEILQKYLAEFNDDVAVLVGVAIGAITNASIGTISSTVRPPSKITLSSLLYKNSDYVAKQVIGVLKENLLERKTIDAMRTALYDGYGYDEVLQIAKDAKLPKYLLKGLTETKISKLKTKSLKAGYMKVLKAKSEKAMKKALYVAAQEKARYYALRIAVTEEQKSFNQMLAAEYLEEGVEYVQVTLSLTHETTCVCDSFAGVDNGYGPGVYKLRNAPMPPYHPFCQCEIRPVDNVKWRKAKSDGYLKDFTKQQQTDIERGLNSKWNVLTVGDVF